MKRKILLILFLVTLAVVGCVIRFWFPSWEPSQRETVFTSDGKRLNVVCAVLPCVYVAPRHASGIYLRSGATRVDVERDGRSSLSFSADEELSLFAVHQLVDAVYLIFMAEYKPERGFLAFTSSAGESFRPIAVNSLPPQIAYPNFGSRVAATHQILNSNAQPPAEFYHMKTAWLWSQIATNKSVAAENMNVEAVDKFWGAWATKFADQMSRGIDGAK